MNLRFGKQSSAPSTPARRRYRYKGLIALVAVVVGGVATPFAYAYWTTSGTGAGAASAGTLERVTIDTVDIGAALRPNGPPSNVTVHITNPNNYAVDIDGVTPGTITSNRPGCSGSGTGVTLNFSAVTGSLAPGASSFIASASMDATSVSACQGATFSSVLTLAVHK